VCSRRYFNVNCTGTYGIKSESYVIVRRKYITKACCSTTDMIIYLANNTSWRFCFPSCNYCCMLICNGTFPYADCSWISNIFAFCFVYRGFWFQHHQFFKKLSCNAQYNHCQFLAVKGLIYQCAFKMKLGILKITSMAITTLHMFVCVCVMCSYVEVT
jgi:hypothetical protein